MKRALAILFLSASLAFSQTPTPTGSYAVKVDSNGNILHDILVHTPNNPDGSVNFGAGLLFVNGVEVTGGGGGGGAPVDAGYITKTANATLTDEFPLSSLLTGILKNTTTTGVPSIAVAGTDYVAPNAAITGATNTKITYDAKGLVTSGTAATTADIADSTDRRYVTDAQSTVIGNTSGTNTGDQLTFKTVAVATQSDIVADSTTDTLNLAAGSGITITTTAGTDTATITATGAGGTVTSVGIIGGDGIGVADSPITTSGDITLSLGALTPTSVAATGTVTGSNLSGTNTGDQIAGAGLLQTGQTIDIVGNDTLTINADNIAVRLEANKGLLTSVAGIAIVLSGGAGASGLLFETGALAVDLDGTSLARGAGGLSVADAGITMAKLANLTGLSVIGRSANTLGVPAAITGTDGGVLRVSGTTLGFGTIPFSSLNTTPTTLAGYGITDGVPASRTISTTSPLNGGGDLSANRTLTIDNAQANGTNKGAASFTAVDFNDTSGNISLDYINGQAASGSTKGFLAAADWTTFNGKQTQDADLDFLANTTFEDKIIYRVSEGVWDDVRVTGGINFENGVLYIIDHSSEIETTLPTVASAGTIDVTGVAPDNGRIDVTGTTGPITEITIEEGRVVLLRFPDGVALTHSANLLLPGGVDIPATVGGWGRFYGGPSDVTTCTFFSNANDYSTQKFDNIYMNPGGNIGYADFGSPSFTIGKGSTTTSGSYLWFVGNEPNPSIVKNTNPSIYGTLDIFHLTGPRSYIFPDQTGKFVLCPHTGLNSSEITISSDNGAVDVHATIPSGTHTLATLDSTQTFTNKTINASQLVDASVTLAKMADMATASVIYRKTAGTGVPEVQSLATLKTDLAVPVVSDTAYDATSWNANTDAPTKNAVRDKIETVTTNNATAEILLSSTSVNLNSVANTTLYTVPASRSLVITRITVHHFSAAGDSAAFDVQLGGVVLNNSLSPFDLVGSAPLDSNSLLDLSWTIGTFNGANYYGRLGSASDVLRVVVTTAEGSALTAVFDVFGYLTDTSGVAIANVRSN